MRTRSSAARAQATARPWDVILRGGSRDVMQTAPGSSASARDRLRRIRNWQSSEFYARLVMRPLTILVMLVVGDCRILTPNRVTTLANAAKLLGAALLVIDHREHAIGAAIWIQIGLLLDHLDGTLARYRG